MKKTLPTKIEVDYGPEKCFYAKRFSGGWLCAWYALHNDEDYYECSSKICGNIKEDKK